MQYTYRNDKLRNIRIEQLTSKDYIGRNVGSSELRQTIQDVCDKYKNKTVKQLTEYVSEIIELTEYFKE